VDPQRFIADVEAKPASLRALAEALDEGTAFGWPELPRNGRVLLIGMGSSCFVGQVAALRLRRHGITAVAEIASAEQTWLPGDGTTVVAISASGRSTETLDLATRLQGRGGSVIALTNTDNSPLRNLASHAVDLGAGDETSGIACRSELHTLIALLALEQAITGTSLELADACRCAADATESLLASRDNWLAEVAERLAGPHGTWLLAPAERLSSALQGALMLREVARRQADACETGDWSHVDVYLTKTLDYRALVFPGSRYDAEAARWMSERGSIAVSVHADHVAGFPAAVASVTYPAGGNPLTPLLVETTVPELVAEHWFTAHSATPAS
jgi:glucosamine--fructose-6-phosphate aminotransferase (isomerizing)